MKSILSSLLLVAILSACNSTPKVEKEPPPASPPATTTSSLPPITEEVMDELLNECDFVDYIFYELPFSMSYDQKSTIQTALGWVTRSAEIPSTGCKGLGRMIFQKQGVVIIEAEIYVSEACAHYKWIKDGKTMYASAMSPAGKQHYMGNINQFKK